MKNQKIRTVKGAVLIMVLTVMTVIIILCGAALALSVSINNRTANKYSDNQAYFAARSALNTALACIQNYTGTEDDQYVKLAKAISQLAEGHTNDYFVGETVIDVPPAAGAGVATPVQLRFENIDEDKHLIQITATATYAQSGNASVSVVFSVGEFLPSNNFSNALTTCGNATGVNISAYGGNAINLLNQHTGTINLTNDGIVVGSTIVNGDTNLSTQTIFKMENGQYFVCAKKDNTGETADLNINNLTCFSGITGLATEGENPYVYVSGNINLSNDTAFGLNSNNNISDYISAMSNTSPNQVDLHCNTLTGNASCLTINGNLYIHGSQDEIKEIFDDFALNIQKLIIVDGNIYFDDTAAMSEWEQRIIELGCFQNGININGADYDTRLDGVHYDGYEIVDEEHSKDNFAEHIISPYEEVQNFQDVDADGNYLFENSIPVLIPVKSCPSNANSIADYENGDEYIIETGTNELINIDLSGAYIQNKTIVVKGTGICNFFVESGTTCVLESSSIITEELYDMSSGGRSFSNLKFQCGEGSVTSPNINMYLEDNSNLRMRNNSLISGYIYGPNANVEGMGKSVSFTYLNEDCGTRNGVSVMGAVICGNLNSSGNNFVAIYIPQGDAANDAAKGADGSDLRFKYYSN